MSRCVPSSQNSKQGSTLSAGYKNFCKNKAPCSFEVFFADEGGVPHCEPGLPNNCAADSAEYESGPHPIIQRRDMIVARQTTNGTYFPGPARFLTCGGKTLGAPHGGTIGQKVVSFVPIDADLYQQQTDTHEYQEDQDHSQYEYMLPNMREQVDYLKEVVQ